VAPQIICRCRSAPQAAEEHRQGAHGDILIVSPNSASRKGDRIVLRTTDGEVMAKILVRRTAKTVELASFNPTHANLVFPLDRIDWMARIVWASQ
jgi:phage repressor protein C with HTH and peptisase S24 domain